MESVKKAHKRFRNYPVLLTECRSEASEYAACVLNSGGIKYQECAKEFTNFKNCIQKAAVKHKTKL